MTPQETLNFGLRLLGQRKATEVDYRNAARAAYYAVYYLMAAHLGLNIEDYDGRHQVVENTLLSIPPGDASDREYLARAHFRSLRLTRVDADYRLQQPFDRVRAERSLMTATKIFAAF